MHPHEVVVEILLKHVSLAAMPSEEHKVTFPWMFFDESYLTFAEASDMSDFAFETFGLHHAHISAPQFQASDR
jgi:hypothetical protein